MAADADHNAQLAGLLTPLFDTVELAFQEGLVDHLALALQRQRLEALHEVHRVVAGRHLDDQMHVAAFGAEARPVLGSTGLVHVVVGVDPIARALVNHPDDAFLGVPLLHHRAVGADVWA